MKSEKSKTIQFSPSVLESETFESTEYKNYVLSDEDVVEELSPACMGDYLWRHCLGEDDIFLYDDEVSETLIDVNTRITKKKNIKKKNDNESTKVVTKSRSRSSASSSTSEREKRNNVPTPKEIIISTPSLKSAPSTSVINDAGAVDQNQRMKPSKDTSGQRSTGSRKTKAKEATADAVTAPGDLTGIANEGRRQKENKAISERTESKFTNTNTTATNDVLASNCVSSVAENVSPFRPEKQRRASAKETTTRESQKYWLVRLVKRGNVTEKKSSPSSYHAGLSQAVAEKMIVKTASDSKDEIESKQKVSSSSLQIEPIVERTAKEQTSTEMPKSVATETPADLNTSQDPGSAHPMNGAGSTGEKKNEVKTEKNKKDGNMEHPSFVLDGTGTSITTISTLTKKVAASANLYTTKSGHLGLKTQNISPTSSTGIAADYLRLVTSKTTGHESVVASKTSKDNEITTSRSILKNRNDVIMIDQSVDLDVTTKDIQSKPSATSSTFTSKEAIDPVREKNENAAACKGGFKKSESPKEMRLRAGSMHEYTGRLSSRKSLGAKVVHGPNPSRLVSVVEKRDEDDDIVERHVNEDEVFLIMSADAAKDRNKTEERTLSDMSLSKVIVDAPKESAISKLWTDWGKMFLKSPEQEKLTLETFSEVDPSEEADGRLSSVKSLDSMHGRVEDVDAEEFILVAGESEGVGWKPVCGVNHPPIQQDVGRKYLYESDVLKNKIPKGPARIGVETREEAKGNHGYDKESDERERAGGNVISSSPSWERRDPPSPTDANSGISGHDAQVDTYVLFGDKKNQKYCCSVDEKGSKSPNPGWRVRPGSFIL